MPNPLPLVGHVLSGRVRILLLIVISTTLWPTVTLSTEDLKNKTKNKILSGTLSLIPNKRSQSMKFRMFLKGMIFKAIYSQVQHELCSF